MTESPCTSRRVWIRGLVLAACVLLAPAAVAQDERPPDMRVDYAFDSGPAVNADAASGRQVVISFPVFHDPATSLRLYFADVELAGSIDAGDESILRITGLLDGAVQTMNAVHLRQWRNSSAYFNGNAVQVEVLAFPSTGQNRVTLAALDVGVPFAPPPSQCGPVDDRVLSNDPRSARLLPIGCTGWLITDCARCFLTAGHCDSPMDTVQFNVPLSTSGGSLNHPGPEDQYAVDFASMQSNGGQGVGNDWAYFGTFPNTNTSLTAFEAQGGAFNVVATPPPAGNSIRITGYGTDFTPQTHNQVQQTHVGPFTAFFGTTVQYQTETTGGSSGSPVIWEETGDAVGIHSHAGCSTSGSGANQGTASVHPALQSALGSPQGVCLLAGGAAGFTDAGGALANFPIQTPPQLTGCGTLAPGGTVTTTVVSPTRPGATVTSTLFVGLSQLNAPFMGGTLVPFPDIVFFGLPLFPTGSGTTATLNIDLTWPTVPSGFELVFQHWVTVQLGANTVLLASNGLVITQP